MDYTTAFVTFLIIGTIVTIKFLKANETIKMILWISQHVKR